MTASSITAYGNEGGGTDQLATVDTPTGKAGQVALVDADGNLITSDNPVNMVDAQSLAALQSQLDVLMGVFERLALLDVLAAARNLDGALRVNILSGTLPSVTSVGTLSTLTTLSNLANQTAMGGYLVNNVVQAKMNLAANQANVINMVG